MRAVAEIDCKLLSRCGSPAFDNSKRRIDLEHFHESAEANIPQILPLQKLVQSKPSQRGVSEVLAWDDLTGMRLDARQVVEARGK